MLLFGCGLAAGAIVMQLALGAGVRSYHRRFGHALPASQPPPAPRLQVHPDADLQTYLAREKQQLSSYGWVDRKKGRARIPIDRAMELLLASHGRRPSSVDATPTLEQRLGQKLPLRSEVRTALGDSVTVRDFLGGPPVVLVFAYFHCPNLCTLVLNGLANALARTELVLGRDYRILTISIDPSENSALALAKQRSYLARLGKTWPEEKGRLAPWAFLTAKEADIQALTAAAGFRYRRDPASGEFSHPSGILLVSPKGEITRYLYGIQFSPRELVDGLRDARDERRGSLTEEILLVCFHYSPRDHANSRLALLLVQWVAAAAALALVTAIALLLRSERSRAVR